MTHATRIIARIAVLVALAAGTPTTAQEASSTTLEMVVERLGGYLIGENPEGPWTIAHLGATQATDADLAHFVGQTALEMLQLTGTQISDAGLVHLRELTTLEHLFLDLTKITDAGLVHLTGLTGLELLSLKETQVTDAGIANLRKVLPNVEISTGVIGAVPPPPPPPSRPQ